MAKRSTQALIGAGLIIAFLVAGFVVLVVVSISSYFGPTEYDFVESTSSSGECFRLNDTTSVVQLQITSTDEDALEVDHAKLIDASNLTVKGIGLVEGPRAPISNEEPLTPGSLEALTVPNKRFLDLRTASPEPVFLLLVVQSEPGEGNASGVTLENSPGEPLWVDDIAFKLEVSCTNCIVTDVTG